MWTDYIRIFRDSNPDIPNEFYGESLMIMVNQKRVFEKMKVANGPRAEDFGLPRTKLIQVALCSPSLFNR